jgi:hypothetical protein
MSSYPAVFWPDGVPQSPLLTGFSMSVADGRMLSKMTTGVGKRRAAWAGLRLVNVSINVTTSQWEILQDFWENTLRHGLDAFWITEPLSDKAGLFSSGDGMLEDDAGTPLIATEVILCQFGTQKIPAIDESYTGDLHKVSFVLEILP